MFANFCLRIGTTLIVGISLSSLCTAESRTWVDSTGKHKISAEFIRLADGNVTLEKDGKEITLPLSKLSRDDQVFIKTFNGTSNQNPATSKAAPADVTAVKQVARKFFASLIDKDEKQMGPLLTAKARAALATSKSLIDGLDSPDDAKSILVRGSKINGSAAEIMVSVRVKRTYKRNQLLLRKEKGQWLVSGVKVDGADKVTDLEGTEIEGSRQGRENAGDELLTSDDDDPFEVPDGDAKQLLAYIATLQAFKPPKGSSRAELVQLQTKLLTAVLEASDKVLNGEANQTETASAVNFKMVALSVLGRSSNDDDIQQRLKDFPAQLESLGLKDFAKNARTLTMSNAVARASNSSEGSSAVTQALNHLKDFDKLSKGEITLAQGAGRLAERLGNDVAIETYNQLGGILQADSKTGPLAEFMFGSARRFGLVGNRMEIVGLTADEKEFDYSQFDGKVVLVDFWATWCGPCLREMPNIRKNYEKYHDRGFEVVAISTDRNREALKKYLEREEPPWTVLVDKHPENTKSMSVYYGVSAIPTTILIGPDGNVITLSCRGERLGQELERLLGEAT